jgi:hypothetical protein
MLPYKEEILIRMTAIKIANGMRISVVCLFFLSTSQQYCYCYCYCVVMVTVIQQEMTEM